MRSSEKYDERKKRKLSHVRSHLGCTRITESTGDDSVPAAVAQSAGERESEASLGESESGMVGVTASAPIDARRSRPPDGSSPVALSLSYSCFTDRIVLLRLASESC